MREEAEALRRKHARNQRRVARLYLVATSAIGAAVVLGLILWKGTSLDAIEVGLCSILPGTAAGVLAGGVVLPW